MLNIFQNIPYGNTKCKICGGEFKKNTKNAVLCSNACRKEYSRLSSAKRREIKRLKSR